MKFKLQCTNCNSANIQPVYEDAGPSKPENFGLSCTQCGSFATMPELEKEWLAAFRDKRSEEQ